MSIIFESVDSPSRQPVAIEFLDSITARTDEIYLQDSGFRGNVFNVEVAGGSRTYYLLDETEVDPWHSKLVVFVGVLMLIFGLIAIFLERKLSRYQC
jgi:hypothetical protein